MMTLGTPASPPQTATATTIPPLPPPTPMLWGFDSHTRSRQAWQVPSQLLGVFYHHHHNHRYGYIEMGCLEQLHTERSSLRALFRAQEIQSHIQRVAGRSSSGDFLRGAVLGNESATESGSRLQTLADPCVLSSLSSLQPSSAEMSVSSSSGL